MNNPLEQHLQQKISKIMHCLNDGELGLAFSEYKELVDATATSKSSDTIVFRGKKGEYLLQNSYLIEKLMEQTQETIRLYINDINVSSYGHLIIRNVLYNWLQDDTKRKVKLLVRKGFVFFSSAFYYTNYKFIKNGQIEVRTLKDSKESTSYAGIFDEKAIKVKVKEIGTETEVMAGNFLDPDQAKKMVGLFDDIFKIAIPVQNKVSLVINKFIKPGSTAKKQNTLIKSLSEGILERVRMSENQQNSVCFDKPIPIQR